VTVIVGECIETMRGMEADSIDAIVTDPPYGLGFMGKKWDALPPGQDWAEECLRVLKPGGHLLAFGGSRTYHRLAVAVEDAGFEIRDQIMWLYGSGFPKSLDVSKALDRGQTGDITAPATPEAVKWSGWGTALKPAHEPVVVARKPLIGTVAQNVERFGVGGLNIDGCRVDAETTTGWGDDGSKLYEGGLSREGGEPRPAEGRWPANIMLDPDAAALLDAQSGPSKSRKGKPRRGTNGVGWGMSATGAEYEDSGGPSRFFYCAKASKKERNAGLDGFDEVAAKRTQAGGDDTRGRPIPLNRNNHPTVKPIEVMRWLVRLVTPPGGTVLDPFTGSGTTGIAAGLEGCEFIGIEMEPEYAEIAEARIAWWADKTGDTKTIVKEATA
jgi:site-specific DNA-methyltransferase (adenine-specific)